ncbi:A/G-specific adenine glycosylase [Trypanosoma grayi]|uniref:A/G-specific adenine glycosylase n=1 Tax=Trypanosoma grayi TaxID=71804 RepID=UPI0004F4A131|nr:A/G-specific adenine glycosylase [Trypanosoma grayi]KEG13071.1 A/G-specific adenine glycosylase [Trypanosoma grayi]
MLNRHREVQQATIEWFHNHQRRDLPWRKYPSLTSSVGGVATGGVASWAPDPYYVWVSEVMSQQTQMDTVIPYFKKWVHLFPTVAALAEASEESVKAAWAGMGYYRRALLLKKGAEYVTHRFGGNLPGTAAQLREIPGIGPYTAAAVASICFGENVVSVDGNVVRVLSRLRCERDFDPKVAKNIKAVMQWGQEIMEDAPSEEPGAFNQGLMEIGARVCKPAGRPVCGECPLQRFCRAYAARERGEIDAIEGVIPLRASTVKKKKQTVLCVVHEFCHVENGETPLSRRFVVFQRPENGLLGGMLEFPSAICGTSCDAAPKEKEEKEQKENNADDDDEKTIVKLKEQLSAGHKAVASVGSIRHIFSHIDMGVLVYHAAWCGTTPHHGGDTTGLKVEKDKSSWAVEQEVCGLLAERLGVASSRIFVKTEEEIKGSAASRLLLKIFQTLPLPVGERAVTVTPVRKRLRGKM